MSCPVRVALRESKQLFSTNHLAFHRLFWAIAGTGANGAGRFSMIIGSDSLGWSWQVRFTTQIVLVAAGLVGCLHSVNAQSPDYRPIEPWVNSNATVAGPTLGADIPPPAAEPLTSAIANTA